MSSFFVEYSFQKVVSGFLCECKGNKSYSIDYYESVDSLIDSVMKLLKENDSTVTFQVFSGYDSTDLLRVLRNYDGTMTAVHWKRNNSGFVYETWTDDQLKISRANVKKYVLEAINLFRAAA